MVKFLFFSSERFIYVGNCDAYQVTEHFTFTLGRKI